MAHPRRVAKVASQIQREISEMFIYDKVLQSAISPERQTGSDALTAIPSITHVHVTNDLQVVKVYVSVYSDSMGKQRALRNLKKLEPYVRHQIGQAVKLRLTPEIRFEYDDSIEEEALIEKVLGPEEVERYRRELAVEAGEQLEESSWPSDGTDTEEGFFDDFEEVAEEPQGPRVGPFDDLFTGSGRGQLVQGKIGKTAKKQKAKGQKEGSAV